MFAVGVFLGIKACGIHAQQPVADGTHQSSLIQALVFRLVLQLLEAFADGFFRKAADPQTLHGAFGHSLLHHPSLYQLSLLAGITAVDNLVGLAHQGGYGVELLLHALVGFQLDAETGWNHGQLA